MKKTNKEISDLLYKHLQGTLSEQEAQTLEDWRLSSDDHAYLIQEMSDEAALSEALHEYHPENKGELRNRILDLIKRSGINTPSFHKESFLQKWRWVAAASIFLMLAGMGYFVFFKDDKKTEKGQVNLANLKAPEIEGAILTLADGRKVVLDSIENGVVAVQHGAEATIRDGQLLYNKTGDAAGEIGYNTLSTPRGKQYRMNLPDGTSVWLNSATTITYPTQFKGHERRVEVDGEAYFEVRGDANQPFVVRTRTAEAIVLGTSFNLNAYENEPIMAVTLLEGIVKVSTTKNSQLLEPGEQANLDITTTTIQLKKDANIEEVLAWKNGWFAFSDASVPEMMRQLSRWYDINVKYEGAVPPERFTGKIDRSLTLDELLKGLLKMKVSYRLENSNTLIIKSQD